MKTGLVLEGGAMRGLYTAGVLDVLMENGITVDGAVGVSAGRFSVAIINPGRLAACSATTWLIAGTRGIWACVP